jgi:ketosteroid isomerase-like protein
MKKLLIAAGLLLNGCATDDVLLRPLPAAGEPSTEVTVIRPRATIQAEWPFYVVVASQPVFDLRNGENTRFRMSSGRQPLVIRCLGGAADKPLEATIERDLPPRGSAYFVVEPKFDCASIQAIDAREASLLLATTRFRALGSVNPMAQAHGDAPAVFSSQPAPAAQAPATPQAQVAAAAAAWVEAFKSRDVARIASLYENDAVLRNASGQRLAAGPGGIAEYFRTAAAAGSIDEQEIRVFGDTAVASGKSHNIVFRQRGGKWLIVDQTLR